MATTTDRGCLGRWLAKDDWWLVGLLAVLVLVMLWTLTGCALEYGSNRFAVLPTVAIDAHYPPGLGPLTPPSATK